MYLDDTFINVCGKRAHEYKAWVYYIKVFLAWSIKNRKWKYKKCNLPKM